MSKPNTILPKKTDDYAVVIPTNRTFDDIAPLLECLAKQRTPPKQLIIVYDKTISLDEYQYYEKSIRQKLNNPTFSLQIISAANHGTFTHDQGASYVRNIGISAVKTPMMCCIDDDNIIAEDFFGKMLTLSSEITQKTQKPHIIIPTEYYRDTHTVRSRGYRGFNHRISRPERSKISIKFPDTKYVPITFCASNCLFGHTEVFVRYAFSREIPFVYEDFIMTRQVSLSDDADLYCATDVFVHHMMRTKTKVQDLYIHSPFHAYQKSRNRIVLVKKTSTPSQKVIYFIFGLWGHTAYLIIVLLLSNQKNKWKIVRSIGRGIVDGIKRKGGDT